MNNLVQYTEIAFRQCNGRGIKGLFLTQPFASKEKLVCLQLFTIDFFLLNKRIVIFRIVL